MRKKQNGGWKLVIPTDFIFLFIIRVVVFLWSELMRVQFYFISIFLFDPSWSESIRVDPTQTGGPSWSGPTFAPAFRKQNHWSRNRNGNGTRNPWKKIPRGRFGKKYILAMTIKWRGMTIIPTLRWAGVVTKKNFFRPFGFQFDLKISGGSHEKFYFVLLQRTDYIYSPWKK